MNLVVYLLKLSFVPTLILFVGIKLANAQDAEDELGNWFIVNSTVRFSDHWSLFTEAHLRLWEVASNLDEIVLRATAHYNFTPDAMVGLGYVRAPSWPFEDGSRNRIENRIYQQLALWQNWGRTRFEHRYRLEQRWLDRDGEVDYSNRARYRLQATIPISNKMMGPKTVFINAYNEIFINFGSQRAFDQNRVYGAVGFQFSTNSILQLGLLWQARLNRDFFRLQMFYTHNFDLRKQSD